jgi:hypothetical protein
MLSVGDDHIKNPYLRAKTLDVCSLGPRRDGVSPIRIYRSHGCCVAVTQNPLKYRTVEMRGFLLSDGRVFSTKRNKKGDALTFPLYLTVSYSGSNCA